MRMVRKIKQGRQRGVACDVIRPAELYEGQEKRIFREVRGHMRLTWKNLA